ncbi:hypothetical protein JCM30237_07830 [Halolamina litorea]|uniref:ArsR family transcriptional regulator n=1 Tax=Halolamina litorea TaxID=1515593 RepID=A0ABD6BRS5_9EURY|nr:ArsR family transcriptional regulator [Halolamina litorea]
MDDSGSRTDGTGESPGFDRQFYRAIASRERRRLLSILLDGDERTVEELATLLLGWEATASGTVGSPDDRRLTLLRLVHIHLPRLDEAEMIEYDQGRGTARIEKLEPGMAEYIEDTVDAAKAPSG